jgi:hypothetical protein
MINGEDFDFGWWRRDTDWLPKEIQLQKDNGMREGGGRGEGGGRRLIP